MEAKQNYSNDPGKENQSPLAAANFPTVSLPLSEQFARAASGIIYRSSMDGTFEAFSGPECDTMPKTAAEFVATMGPEYSIPKYPAYAPERSLEMFLQSRSLRDADNYACLSEQGDKRLAELSQVLKDNISEARVFYVRKGGQVVEDDAEDAFYVVGRTREGTLAGLRVLTAP